MMNSRSYSNTEEEDDEVYSVDLEELTVYKSRIVVCALFCMACFANQVMWVTYVPISNLAEEYLDASTVMINWLSIVWLVTYLPGTLIQAMILDRYDLRTAVVFGATMTVLGALLRVLGASLRFVGGAWAIDQGWQYALQFLGQFIASLAQPIFLNLPGNISSAWFPPHERDVSTTVASVCGPIGNALGSILPSLFIKAGDSERVTEANFLNLLLCEFIFAAVAFGFVFRYFESRPPTPPSESERMRQKLLAKGDEKIETSILAASISSHHSGALEGHINDIRSAFSSPPPVPEREPSAPGSVWRQVCWLASNRNYVLLFITYSVGIGVFNLILTLVNQIVEPYGFSNDEAGYCNFSLIITGLVGAVFSSKILETFKAYDTVIKVGYFGSLISILILVEALEVNFPLLCFGFSLLGFFVLPLLPAAIECCAEITYPYVSEDIAVGGIFLSGNLTGAAFAFIGEILLENYDANQVGENKVSPFAQPSNLFTIVTITLSCMTIFLFKGNYARLGLDYVVDTEDGSPILRDRLSSDGRTASVGTNNGGWNFATFLSSQTRTPIRRRVSKDSTLEKGLLDEMESEVESEAVVSPPRRTETGTYSITSADENPSISYANSQRDTIQASHSPVKRALNKLGPMSPSRGG